MGEILGLHRMALRAKDTTRQPGEGMCPLQSNLTPCAVERLRNALLVTDETWENARRICCNTLEKRLLPGRPLPVIAATSLYSACREGDVPLSIKDVAAAAKVKRVEVGRSYKILVQKMGSSPSPPNQAKYVLKIASAAGISQEATAMALKVEREAIEKGLEDRTPMTVAAASVYVACLLTGEELTQSDIAEAAGVSVVSVRECSKAMRSVIWPSETPAPEKAGKPPGNGESLPGAGELAHGSAWELRKKEEPARTTSS